MSPRFTTETARAANAARAAQASAPPPEGWPSWAAYRLYAEDADGGRAPYRMPDPFAVRTFVEAMAEVA